VASLAYARNVGVAVNVGALGLGPLVAGFLAQRASDLVIAVFVGLSVPVIEAGSR
jgi:hypothetical protein